ncbi:MAG: DNA-directed RNA polymerase subunit omega [Acidobacteria bacterium]|nr:DNA-directed RNA polymerase subunit omega [Acidobacteriota bacterium]
MNTEISAAEEAPVAEPAVEAVESEEWPEQEPLTRESRFLYVDVAARRAKQLRRGALPRLAGLAPDPETGERPKPVAKLERIAMEEVDKGLIVYALPEPQEPESEES